MSSTISSISLPVASRTHNGTRIVCRCATTFNGLPRVKARTRSRASSGIVSGPPSKLNSARVSTWPEVPSGSFRVHGVSRPPARPPARAVSQSYAPTRELEVRGVVVHRVERPNGARDRDRPVGQVVERRHLERLSGEELGLLLGDEPLHPVWRSARDAVRIGDLVAERDEVDPTTKCE